MHAVVLPYIVCVPSLVLMARADLLAERGHRQRPTDRHSDTRLITVSPRQCACWLTVDDQHTDRPRNAQTSVAIARIYAVNAMLANNVTATKCLHLRHVARFRQRPCSRRRFLSPQQQLLHVTWIINLRSCTRYQLLIGDFPDFATDSVLVID